MVTYPRSTILPNSIAVEFQALYEMMLLAETLRNRNLLLYICLRGVPFQRNGLGAREWGLEEV